MANEMKIQIGADVNGAVQGLNQVAAASQKTTQALGKMPGTTSAATQSLINLSRVAQDAPYGFIGIANNLNPLLESFQRLKQTTGSTGGALQALKAGLTGPAGIGLALGVVSSLLITFGDKLFGSTARLSAFSKILADAKTQFTDVYKSVQLLSTNIELARNGFISKDSVVKQYNDTIGKTAGLVKNLDEAEQGLAKNAPAYIDFTLKKAIANIAFGKAGELAFKLEQLQQKFTEAVGQPTQGILQTRALNVGLDETAKEMGKVRKEMESLLNIGKGAEKDAGFISKLFNFNFAQDIQPGTVKKNIEKQLREKLGTINLELIPVLDVEKSESSIRKSVKKIEDIINKDLSRPTPRSGVGPLGTFAELSAEKIKQFNQIAGVLTNVLTPAFDAFFSAVQKGENVFKAFGQAVVNALTQMIAKLAATAAISGILSGLGFGSFSTIFSMLSHRAGGGPVSGGTPYIVGEKGPEIFMPANSGKIIPSGSGRFQSGNLGGLIGQVNFQISGNNLVGVLSNANRSQRRLV